MQPAWPEMAGRLQRDRIGDGSASARPGEIVGATGGSGNRLALGEHAARDRIGATCRGARPPMLIFKIKPAN